MAVVFDRKTTDLDECHARIGLAPERHAHNSQTGGTMSNKVKINHGIFTKASLGVAIAALVPPLATLIIGTVENVAVHWSGAEKTSVIAGAGVVVIGAVGKFAQAVAAILKGSTEV